MADPRAQFVITAQDRASKILKGIRGDVGKVEKSLRALGSISLGGLIGAGGLTALAAQSISAADAIGKTADKLGLGVEALQEYRFAAEQSGVSANTFDMAIQRLGRRLAEADNGTGEAVKALEELGVSTRNAQGQLKTIDEILPELADKFGSVSNQIDRNRLAQKLFDSEGVALVNLLRQQSGGLDELRQQARDAGLVLSDELVRGAEKANDELNLMKRTVNAQFTRAFVELAPAITDVSTAMATLAVESGKAFQALSNGLGIAVGQLLEGPNTITEIRRKRISDLEDFEKELQAKLFNIRGSRGSAQARGELEERLKNVRNQIGLLKDSLKDPALQSLQADVIGLARGGNAPPAPRPERPVEADKQTERASRATSALTEAQRAYNKLLAEGKSLTESLFTPQEAYAAQIERLNLLRGKEIISQETYNRAVADYQDRLDEATGKVQQFADLQAIIAEVDPVAPLLKQLDALAELEQAYPAYADVIAEAMFNVQSEIDKVNQGLQEQKDEVKDVESAWQELGPTFSSAFEDAIVEGKNLSDVLKGLEQDILRIVTRDLITKPLGDAIGGLFGGGGGGFGDFFGSIFGGARAMGGPVSSGRAYIVGEKGPELFMPRGNGQILPAGQTAKSVGNTYNFSFSIPTDSADNRRTAQQVAREAARYMQIAQGAV